MAEDGYNRNSIIGGYKGAPIKQSMLGKNLKTRGALSNNLPFRLANGLAPSNEYGFLFPTGAEAGAVWRFSQSGGQYQEVSQPTGGNARITAIGQAIATQLDSRIIPISHSIDLNAKSKVYGGTGASTISVGSNTVTFTNAGVGDYVDFSGGAEFSAAEFAKCEVSYLQDNPSNGSILVYAGNAGTNNTLNSPTVPIVSSTLNSASGLLRVHCNTAGLNAKVTILSITGYPGNHLSQATSTSRPLSAIESIGGWNQSVYSGRFDGVDDGESTPAFVAGTLTNNMDLFVAIKRNSSAKGIILNNEPATSARYVDFDPGNATVGGAVDNSGAAWTMFVDSVQIAGTATASPANLDAALTPNNWHVLEIRNLDMSAWTQLSLGLYPSFMPAANLGDVILCPAQSASNRALTRTLVGASVGLLL